MATELLSERYAEQISGVLACYDRIVISGNLQPLCYAKGMTKYLYNQQIRIFDYTELFAEPLRELIRTNAETLAKANNIEIEFVNQSVRKEEQIQTILAKRGDGAGLVHILSAMESCVAYKPWHDKVSGKTYVQSVTGKCLHYYFYFIDAELGLCYLRVPTWSPFRLQFYCNGHNWLAQQLQPAGISYRMVDNAFVEIGDFAKANQLAQCFNCEQLQAKLDEFAHRYCPAVSQLQLQYNWTLLQVAGLQAFYPHLVERLIQAVKPADIATFLGRKLHGNYQDEMGNRFNHRWLGTRIKHQMGPVTLKLYDKFNLILRMETTVNQVNFFDQRRQVQHRNGSTSTKWAPMKKTIHSLPPLCDCLHAVNQRYLKFISDIDLPLLGVKKLHQLTITQLDHNHRYAGFNLLSEEHSSLLSLLLSGEFFINGFTNKLLRTKLANKSSAQISHLLKRLRVHGLLKKVNRSFKYYLTDFGRQAATLALSLRQTIIIPTLAQHPTP
jgi:hypothetical protein